MLANSDDIQDISKQIFKLYETNQLDEGLNKAINLVNSYPGFYLGYYFIGLHAQQVGSFGDAQCWFKKAISLQSDDLDCWARYAETLVILNDNDRALLAYKRVAALSGYDDKVCRLIIGDIYRTLEQHLKSLPYYKKVIELDSEDFRGYMGVACVLHFLRKTEDAEPYYLKALALVSKTQNPQMINAVEWEYAMQALLKGDFKQGWKYYDARLLHNQRFSIYPFDLPNWSGKSLEGKTILIQGEQGYGDVIMFASILPEIINQAKKVIIACQPSLVDLFKRSFPLASVEELNPFVMHSDGFVPNWLIKYPQIDYTSAIGSLPRWQRTSFESFPELGCYLTVDKKKADDFAQRLAEADNSTNKKIGLVWQGNMSNGQIGERKSVPAHLLKTFTEIAGATFVSLQLESIEKQLDDVPELNVVRMGQHFKNLDHTAALISQLDIVVCVDTVTAHLAAALGKPVIIMLWFAADWRYLEFAESCYWYPDMSIVRQAEAGNWTPVLNTTKQKILTFLESNPE